MSRRGRSGGWRALRLVVALAIAAYVLWRARPLDRPAPVPAPPPAAEAPRADAPPATPARPAGEPRRCERVVDGDTILLDGRERVRLIGVDTPESVDPRRPVEAFGKEAAAFTRRLATGQRVWLEYDRERRDRHGRTLAYVFLEDGTLLNAELIRQGYGHAYTRHPFARMEEFVALEREAREAKRGLWGDAGAR